MNNRKIVPVEMDTLFFGRPTDYDLYDFEGKLLLAKGEFVTQRIYELLLKRQVFRLSLGNQETKRFSAEVYSSVVDAVQQLYYKTALVDDEQLQQTVDLVELLVEELEDSPRTFINLNQLRTYDNYIYIHSVNVAILAGLIGRELGYSGILLKDIVLGALLHDLGKILIPKNILDKPSALTLDEFTIVKQHPEKGIEMLSNVQISATVLNIVRHHHERWDGNGYPYGLEGNKNSLYSQIVAVADVFDAITADRPYRKGLPFYHSYELLINNPGLNPDVLNAIKNCIVFYPENSLVILNTGEIGQVIEVPINYPTRPTVRILFDAEGAPSSGSETVSLMKDLTLFIKEVKF